MRAQSPSVSRILAPSRNDKRPTMPQVSDAQVWRSMYCDVTHSLSSPTETSPVSLLSVGALLQPTTKTKAKSPVARIASPSNLRLFGSITTGETNYEAISTRQLGSIPTGSYQAASRLLCSMPWFGSLVLGSGHSYPGANRRSFTRSVASGPTKSGPRQTRSMAKADQPSSDV